MSTPGKPQSFKNDFLDALEVVHLRKIAVTTWLFLKYPKTVIESIAEGKGEYVNPVKFLLAIGAPVIVILSLLSPDVGRWEMTNVISHLSDPDPAVRQQSARVAEFYMPIINKMTGELTPLIYLFTMPMLALITKWFYRRQRRPFYYYLTVAYYIGGIFCLFDLTTHLLGYYVFGYYRYYDLFFLGIGCLMLMYFYRKIFNEGPRARFKAIAIPLLCSVLYFLSTGVIFLASLLAPKIGFSLTKLKFAYNPSYATGEVGTYLDTGTDSLIRIYNLKIGTGRLVELIVPGSPAAKSGLKEGDVIVKIKNRPILDDRDYRIGLDSLESGDSVTVDLNRSGENVQVRLSVLPYAQVFPPPKQFVGILRLFAPNSVNSHGFISGTRITEVRPNSPAELGGLRVNDLMVMVDADTLNTWKADWVAFSLKVTQKNVGDTTIFSVIRNNDLLKLSVVMANYGVTK